MLYITSHSTVSNSLSHSSKCIFAHISVSSSVRQGTLHGVRSKQSQKADWGKQDRFNLGNLSIAQSNIEKGKWASKSEWVYCTSNSRSNKDGNSNYGLSWHGKGRKSRNQNEQAHPEAINIQSESWGQNIKNCKLQTWSMLQNYNLGQTERVSVIKNWLGKEGLQHIVTLDKRRTKCVQWQWGPIWDPHKDFQGTI